MDSRWCSVSTTSTLPSSYRNRSGQARLIIDAPDDVQVFREEILERTESGCMVD
ncbi:MAG: carbon storage regulator [Candidatus Thiodiazotropha endolucinida]